MGDIQEWFIEKGSGLLVSISSYHIPPRPGPNPINQAHLFHARQRFHLLWSRTWRGMDIAPNLSFFFSSGMDPEYSGSSVASPAASLGDRDEGEAAPASGRRRRKYHVQTSGRCTRRDGLQRHPHHAAGAHLRSMTARTRCTPTLLTRP